MSSRRNVLFLFLFSFQTAAVIIILAVSLVLLAGSNSMALYIKNDFMFVPQKVFFVVGFIITYLMSVLIGIKSLALPSYDFFNRLIATNLFLFSIYGFALAFFRVEFLSRTLLISEFVLTTVLLIVFFHLKLSWFPSRIGFLGNNIQRFRNYSSIDWIPCDDSDDTLDELDAFFISSRLAGKDSEQSRILLELVQRNIPVFHERALHEQLSGRIDLAYLSDEELQGFQPPRLYFVIKRFGELCLVLIMIPCLLVLSSLIAALIKLTSRGPVLYKQERVGLHGKPFCILKFRTMYDRIGTSDRLVTEIKDKRITRIGRWLRHFRLDELPQFWNILRGEMSLIGPRPEQPLFAEQFSKQIPYYDFRHAIRPGITGWAQVSYGYAASERQNRDKLEYDLFYIKHMSLWLDINIVLKTTQTVILGTGAR